MDWNQAGLLRKKSVEQKSPWVGPLVRIQAFAPECDDRVMWFVGPTSVAMGFEPQRRFRMMDIEQVFRPISCPR